MWVIDCYGRACHGDRIRGYGCKLKAGDTVGVLLNSADNSLSFFVEGAVLAGWKEDWDGIDLVQGTFATNRRVLF